MDTILISVLAAILLSVAAYTHYQLPRFISKATGVMITRVVLIVVGVGIGYITMRTYGDPNVPPFVLFAAGFGLVHVPAAFILFSKRERGSGKS